MIPQLKSEADGTRGGSTNVCKSPKTKRQPPVMTVVWLSIKPSPFACGTWFLKDNHRYGTARVLATLTTYHCRMGRMTRTKFPLDWKECPNPIGLISSSNRISGSKPCLDHLRERKKDERSRVAAVSCPATKTRSNGIKYCPSAGTTASHSKV